MKKNNIGSCIFTFILCAFVQCISAQDSDRCYLQREPLSYYSYQKMMRDHYNFTILGTQSPVSGFKLETNKPSATIKGNIFSSKERQLLVNLELQGGADNDLVQLFSGDKLNGFFRASLGFNVQLSSGNNAKYVLDDLYSQRLLRKKACEYREQILLQIDTFLVLHGFQHMVTAKDFILDNLVTYVIDEAENKPFKYKDYVRQYRGLSRQQYYKELVVAMIKKYSVNTPVGTDDSQYNVFINALAHRYDRSLQSAKLASDFTRLSIFQTDEIYKYHLMDDNEIVTYKNVWRSKSIAWLNVSVTGANTTFSLFDTTKLSLTGSHVFTPSLSITINYLKKWTAANKYFYARFGITFKKSNSLIDLETFDYKKQSTITSSSTSQLITEKSGTAYKGTLSTGIGFDVPLEMYFAPWNQDAIPGFYAKLQYSYGAAWLNQNKIGMDLGLVWNVNSSAPDAKSVFTMIPYVSWTDLATEYKDTAKTQEKKLSDMFSVGVKVGIPINLGK